jgi:hypothetical protein
MDVSRLLITAASVHKDRFESIDRPVYNTYISLWAWVHFISIGQKGVQTTQSHVSGSPSGAHSRDKVTTRVKPLGLYKTLHVRVHSVHDGSRHALDCGALLDMTILSGRPTPHFIRKSHPPFYPEGTPTTMCRTYHHWRVLLLRLRDQCPYFAMDNVKRRSLRQASIFIREAVATRAIREVSIERKGKPAATTHGQM